MNLLLIRIIAFVCGVGVVIGAIIHPDYMVDAWDWVGFVVILALAVWILISEPRGNA